MGVVGAIGGRVINFSSLLHQVPPVLYRWENRVGEQSLIVRYCSKRPMD